MNIPFIFLIFITSAAFGFLLHHVLILYSRRIQKAADKKHQELRPVTSDIYNAITQSIASDAYNAFRELRAKERVGVKQPVGPEMSLTKLGPSDDHYFQVDDIGSGKVITVNGERGRVAWKDGPGSDIVWKPLPPKELADIRQAEADAHMDKYTKEWMENQGLMPDTKGLDDTILTANGLPFHKHKWISTAHPLRNNFNGLLKRKPWVEFHTCKCGAWKEIMAEYEDACQVSSKVVRKSDNA